MASEETMSDVKMEPDSNSTIYPDPGQQVYPQPDTSVLNYFLSLRTNVEQTSQILTDTWGQLNGLLDTYKSQLYSVEALNIQPGSDDLMKLLMSKEQENGRLREELRLLNAKYDTDITERDQKIQTLQFDVSTVKRQKDALSLTMNQKTRRFEKKIRGLERKLEKSQVLVKTVKNDNKWNNRPSGRLLPGAGLVERTPTPTQVARVTPVPTPDKTPSGGQRAHYDQYAVKTESSSESSGEGKTDNHETYMTVQPEAVEEQNKYVTDGVGKYAGTEGGQSEYIYPVGSAAPVAVTNQSLFLCPHCTQSFNNVKALDHHLQAAHRKFVCPHCYEQYNKKYDLLNHVGLMHGKM